LVIDGYGWELFKQTSKYGAASKPPTIRLVAAGHLSLFLPSLLPSPSPPLISSATPLSLPHGNKTGFHARLSLPHLLYPPLSLTISLSFVLAPFFPLVPAPPNLSSRPLSPHPPSPRLSSPGPLPSIPPNRPQPAGQQQLVCAPNRQGSSSWRVSLSLCPAQPAGQQQVVVELPQPLRRPPLLPRVPPRPQPHLQQQLPRI
jgi:hypothetical protein